MRTGRPKAAQKLNQDEKRELTSLAHRSRSAPAHGSCLLAPKGVTTRRWRASCTLHP